MATIAVLNTSANISSKTLLAAENDTTVTGLLTFDRDPSAPFAVSASSAVVTNLDADKLDGQHAPTGTIVGTSDSQTLTNKSLTSPVLTGTITGAGLLTLTGTGGYNLGAGGSGAQSYMTLNGSSAAASAPYTAYSVASTPKLYVGIENGVLGGSGTNGLLYAPASTGIKFYTGAASRWGINSSGDITTDSGGPGLSVGTPTITAGGGTASTIQGRDYFFEIFTGSTASTTISVGFGHAPLSSVPIVIPVAVGSMGPITVSSVNASGVVFTYGSTTSGFFSAFVIAR